MSLLEVVIRILLALVLGGLIGLEREIHEHAAGFRTHILVAVGAAAFTLASSFGLEGTNHDPNRISAQVVTGIGFLGAGAIVRYGVTVRGLTTASSLWAVAAVGLTVGQGFYSAAVVTTVVVIVSLSILGLIEDRLLYKRVSTAVGLKVQFRSQGYTPLTVLLSALEQAHVSVKEMAVVPGDDDTTTLHLRLSLPRTVNQPSLLRIVTSLKEVQSATVD
jgi:putative Mg2+ transporter-C (MgtC) family protein